jgi:hypothetical protein
MKYVFTVIPLYRVSQEECARLREGVPYVKIYRYSPKHLCPKLNGYGDNGQRKVRSCVCSTHYTLTSVDVQRAVEVSFTSSLSVAPAVCVTYSAWNPNDNYDIEWEFFL